MLDREIIEAILKLKEKVEECYELFDNLSSLEPSTTFERIMKHEEHRPHSDMNVDQAIETVKKRVEECERILGVVSQIKMVLRSYIVPLRVSRPEKLLEELARFAMKEAYRYAKRKRTMPQVETESVTEEQPIEISEELLQKIDEAFSNAKK